MIDLTAHMTASQMAPVFGIAGLAGQLVWPLFRKRGSILITQLAAACCFGTSYALMGQQTGAAVCLTGAMQTTVALLAGDRPWLSRMGYVFLPAVLAIGALTWSGLPTLFAVTACCLVMVARLQADTLRMRRVQLTAAPFGMAHDTLIGAWPCLAAALLSFGIAASAYRRELILRGVAAQAA
ncbi:YgjV family protein [Psychromarinibacter sp. S121]|uniref:YgjV family protein n=1 Tax=Psychromarinibacter sp. S121 TaxID=3415127 RepID=UPI003C7D7E86